MLKLKIKNKYLKKAVQIFIGLYLASMLYVIIGKWLLPPVTITQLTDAIVGNGLKRDYVSWDEISRNVKLAAMASEDQLFVEHGGFDWKSMDKSINGPKKKKKTRGGGASTISQQVAKNVFLWQGHGISRYIRKVPEFYYTQMIEWVWGKQRILEVYLNVIEMGPGIYGIEAAAQSYFHKSAKNLSQAEAAMIIACLPNPKKFTVKPMSRRVQWRYPKIVQQMQYLQGDEDIEALLNAK